VKINIPMSLAQGRHDMVDLLPQLSLLEGEDAISNLLGSRRAGRL
jgi:hypothetical protein